MGYGKLNIWVRYEPEITWSCRVDDKNEWYVTIKDCTGRIVERCGKPMSWIGPTECGHLEVEVPPGCYVISAISKALVRILSPPLRLRRSDAERRCASTCSLR